MSYSFSRIDTYNQCPLKYKYKYIDRIPVPKQDITADLILWTIVHSILEKLYKSANSFKILELSELLQAYDIDRQKQMSDYEKQGMEIKVKGWYVLDDYVRRWRKYVEMYYDHNKPFDQNNVISTESQINFFVDKDNKFAFGGKIDRVDRIGDEFVVIDYKTNQKLPETKDTWYTDQIGLYAYGISQNYSKFAKKIKTEIHYLHHDLIDEKIRSADDFEALRQKYTHTIGEIEDNTIKNESDPDWEYFPPIKNHYCQYCPFQTICPVFAQFFRANQSADWVSQTMIKELVDEYVTTKSNINLQTKQLENIKTMILQYTIQNKKLKQIRWNKSKISVLYGNSLSIKDKSSMTQKLKDIGLLAKSRDLSNSKIKKLIDSWELDLDAISDIVNYKKTYTFKWSLLDQNDEDSD